MHNWLIHVHAIYSSKYMYMKNVNDVTGWLSQTTDISKYFVWSPGLRDKESRLYILYFLYFLNQKFQPLAIFCGSTARFVSDLVGYHRIQVLAENLFPHDMFFFFFFFFFFLYSNYFLSY